MSERRHLTINGRLVEASVGETLIDAALGGLILIPSDCRSGQCESCRVTVVAGEVDDRGTAERGTVLACQATVLGDATIEFDELPLPVKATGVVNEINSLSPDILEVVVGLRSPFEFRPGQYIRLKFSGFPAREYSPTYRLDGSLEPDQLVFHIRRLRNGVVSSELGRAIGIGHTAFVQGPFGNSYLRKGAGPLVLVASGTGWAPIWSVARSARIEQRHRSLTIVAGSRDLDNLYMNPALKWLADDGVRDIVATVETGASEPAMPGSPTAYLRTLDARDTIYVAGAPGLVDAVRSRARAANARCYADPFLASTEGASLTDRIARAWRGLREPIKQSASTKRSA